MKRIGSIAVGGRQMLLDQGNYKKGEIAIQLVSIDDCGFPEPWGVLTTNIPGVHLDRDEILVKTWGENEQFRSPLLASGFFEDTGRRIPTGYVMAEVWQLQGTA